MKELAILGRLLRGRLDFSYDRIVHRRENLRPRQAINYAHSRIEARLRRANPSSYPIGLQLEPTTHCQLNCTYCPRQRAAKDEPRHMAWENFERLMKEIGPHLIAVALWQWGEPLLHPRIADMVALAHELGVMTMISTNGQFEPGSADVSGLIEAGLDLIIVSVDGASQGAYEKFRRGGSVARAHGFIRELCEGKKRLGRDKPVVNVRIIATSENEREITVARDMAAACGADLFSVKSVSLYYDGDPGNPALPADRSLRSYQYQGPDQASTYAAMPNRCIKTWSWPTLRQDGTLLLCECDHDMRYSLGNVFTTGSFRRVWRGEKACTLRRYFTGHGPVNLEFCLRCRYKLDDAIRSYEWLKAGGTLRRSAGL